MIDFYNPHFLFTTFFGLGKLFKKGAGTVGSIIAFPMIVILFKLSHFIIETVTGKSDIFSACCVSLGLNFLICIIAIYSCSKYAKLANNKDPKEVIIDEIVGQNLVLLTTLPFTDKIIELSVLKPINYNYLEIAVISSLAAFILFRIFDIFKPWPVNYIDQKMEGGLGIMLDDVAAAILAIISYYFILFYIVIDIFLS